MTPSQKSRCVLHPVDADNFTATIKPSSVSPATNVITDWFSATPSSKHLLPQESVADEVYSRIAAGDVIWLHDREIAEDDPEKFIVDRKIVAELRVEVDLKLLAEA